MTQRKLGVALLGCGTVGSQVLQQLTVHNAELTQRIGAQLQLVGVAVRRASRNPIPAVSDRLLTTDAASLIARDDVDIVIEVVGGVEPARTWLTDALTNGKSVVTANKALLATDGGALHDAAAAGEADLYYEAAVAGAIPVLRSMRESLHGDRVHRVLGIVNGTTNYILSNMDKNGTSVAECLDEATALGYAEADPTADIDGFDPAAKAAILASLAFHTRVTIADVYREGITHVTADDVACAQSMGSTIKLLCIAERAVNVHGHESVGVRVHPAMIPRAHPLASVHGGFNAVFVEAEAAGPLMFYGQGAGGVPTASAVLGDVVAVARNRLARGSVASESTYAALPIRPMGDTLTRYYVRLDVADRPGVLALVASVFAAHSVSIATVQQEGSGDSAVLVLVTHTATEAALRATVTGLRELDVVYNVRSVLRVEG